MRPLLVLVPLLLTTAAAPALADGSSTLEARGVGALHSQDLSCTSPLVADFLYDGSQMEVGLVGAGCVPAAVTFPECFELEEPGYQWPVHVICFGSPGAPDWWFHLDHDGLFRMGLGPGRSAEGAWVLTSGA